MIRVLGGAGDPGTRYENRVGEPAANPYLYIAAQIAAGLDGMERNATPWPIDDEPYAADRPKLPTCLPDALDALAASPLYGEAFGTLYIDYFISLKQAECDRYAKSIEENEGDAEENGVSRWEQNEYFDFF
jgi:glutamine synthetase